MWPFSTRESSRVDQPDLVTRYQQLFEQFREFEQRFKVIEREHEDLHRAYRRLRSSGAAEARDAPGKTLARHPGGDGEGVSRPMTKDELRKTFLTPGFAKKPLPEPQ